MDHTPIAYVYDPSVAVMDQLNPGDLVVRAENCNVVYRVDGMVLRKFCNPKKEWRLKLVPVKATGWIKDVPARSVPLKKNVFDAGADYGHSGREFFVTRYVP